MKKGWLLDYEIKKVFCSPSCHLKYRQIRWERQSQTRSSSQSNPRQWTKQAQFFAPRINVKININNNRTDPDFVRDIEKLRDAREKEALKQEILYYRQSLEELKRKLKYIEAQKKSQYSKPSENSNQQQDDYLLALHQNTQDQAERAFESKYGKRELDSLLGIAQEKRRNYLPWIIGGIVILGPGILIGFWMNKKKKREKNSVWTWLSWRTTSTQSIC